MTQISELKIRVDASGVEKAADALNQYALAAERADAAFVSGTNAAITNAAYAVQGQEGRAKLILENHLERLCDMQLNALDEVLKTFLNGASRALETGS